ncbi:MAG: helix-turn-helix transcriptional regulator [Chloroflexi bacterium]|nr:helix-turn-helix transcriptional regulator [Chloroflexota bacterium]
MRRAEPAGWIGGTSWPRGYLRPCLLLLIAEEPAHGYDLLDRLEELGTPAIDAGTLYRTLRAMEREKLVASRWEVSPTGPARRTYRITDVGAGELTGWVEVLTEGQRAITAYLRRCAALQARERPISEPLLAR